MTEQEWDAVHIEIVRRLYQEFSTGKIESEKAKAIVTEVLTLYLPKPVLKVVADTGANYSRRMPTVEITVPIWIANLVPID